jgi:hypothetical protein
MPEHGFPPEMLHAPGQARRDYFAAKVIVHPSLQQIYHAALDGIRHAAPGTLIFIYGPTGVGKTTLRRKLAAQLIQEALPGLAQDPARLPVVQLEVPAPDSGRFDWGDYYRRALAALLEVRLDHRLDPRVYPALDHAMSGPGEAGLTRRALRLALETALCQRRPLAFLHDEAQHFKAVAGARQLLSQMDALKSLASLSETRLVLFGTYELLELTNLSGQLGRRSLDLHFPRYAPGAPEFKNVVWTFQRHLPLAQEPDLVEHLALLYDQTAGCVGVLKEWLTRALDLALAEQAQTLTLNHLQRSGLSPTKRLQMAREIHEGEAHAHASAAPETEAEIRRLLQLAGSPQRPPKRSPAAAPPAGRTSARQTRRVGERRPSRDPIKPTLSHG